MNRPDLMQWNIRLRSCWKVPDRPIPPAIVTTAPQLRHQSMPDEVGILLPTNPGPRTLVSIVVEHPDQYRQHILGLFLANPLLNLAREQKRLWEAGIRWIANLPSVEQQDTDFSRNLAEVGLDLHRELGNLARFQAHNFNIAAVVADGHGAAKAIEVNPDIMIVMPRVIDFTAGFPSFRQRSSMALEVHKTIVEKGWSGMLLCLGEKSEAKHENLWPEVVNGLICRPERGAR